MTKTAKELQGKIADRIGGAESFLLRAKKEKKENKRNVLISSACSSMRVALEILINDLYEKEKPKKKDSHLYAKIGCLKQRRAINQGQLYKIDRIRSIGNISVHDAEKEISIEEAFDCLADLKEIVQCFLPQEGHLLIRKHFGLYGFYAFLLFVFLLGVPAAIWYFEAYSFYIFVAAMAVLGVLYLSLFFLSPSKRGLVRYRHPKIQTLILPFVMTALGVASYFVFDFYLEFSLYLTIALSVAVGFLPCFFVLLACQRTSRQRIG